MSFDRTHSRAVTGLSGHNALGTHLHLIGLTDSALCRRCGAEDGTLAHIRCVCEVMAVSRHVYLGSCFLEPEYIEHKAGGIWNCSKITRLP
jgi:hypothetical protein